MNQVLPHKPITSSIQLRFVCWRVFSHRSCHKHTLMLLVMDKIRFIGLHKREYDNQIVYYHILRQLVMQNHVQLIAEGLFY